MFFLIVYRKNLRRIKLDQSWISHGSWAFIYRLPELQFTTEGKV